MIEIISDEEYLTFKAPLLETNKVLETKRFYHKDDVEKALDRISNRIKEKTFLGELCSPIPKPYSRHLTVLYKEASHLIIKVEWNDNTLIGTMETLNTNCGNILKNLILNNIPIKFVLRSIANTRIKTGYEIVIDPIHIVTFDCGPSFSNPKE